MRSSGFLAYRSNISVFERVAIRIVIRFDDVDFLVWHTNGQIVLVKYNCNIHTWNMHDCQNCKITSLFWWLLTVLLDMFRNCSSGTNRLRVELTVFAMISASFSLFSRSPPDWKRKTMSQLVSTLLYRYACCYVFPWKYSRKSRLRPLSASNNPVARRFSPFVLFFFYTGTVFKRYRTHVCEVSSRNLAP